MCFLVFLYKNFVPWDATSPFFTTIWENVFIFNLFPDIDLQIQVLVRNEGRLFSRTKNSKHFMLSWTISGVKGCNWLVSCRLSSIFSSLFVFSLFTRDLDLYNGDDIGLLIGGC